MSTLTTSPRETIQLPYPQSHFARYLLLATCLLTALLGRLCFWPIPLEGDGYMFAYMGKLIAHGGRFQHDLIDNKFPTVGLLMTLPWRIFGSWTLGYLLLQIAMSFTGSLLLARTAARHFGEHARHPTFLAAILLLNFTFIVNGGFQLETVQTFFSILAAGAALEVLNSNDPRDAFTAGLAAGVAAMLKPTGLSVLAALAVAELLQARRNPRRPLQHGLACLAGLAIPVTVTFIYLIGADNLRDMPGLLHQISLYASQSLWQPWDLVKPISVVLVLGFPLFVRGYLFRRGRSTAHANQELIAFVLAWFALEFLGIILQRRMYAYHFLVLAAPTALLFGLLPRQDRTGVTAAALAPILILSLWSSIAVIQDLQHRPASPDIVTYLRKHTQPSDSVWQDRVMAVLLETDLQPGSRLPMTYLFMNSDKSPLLFSKTILDDFRDRRPIYILLPTDVDQYADWYSKHLKELAGFPARRTNFVKAWADIATFVKSHYVPETQLGTETIYRRKDSIPVQARID